MEKFKPGICEDILVLNLVNNLSNEGKFLTQKISENITKYHLEFKDYDHAKEKINNLSKNPLLLDFLGKDNVAKVVQAYAKKK